MDIGAVTLTLWFWLLPAITKAGVIRNADQVCDTYYYGGQFFRLATDCSNRGLSELPDGLSTETALLDLSNNNFVEYPEGLQYFNELDVLQFSGNGLNTPLPTFMGTVQFATLNLSNNNYNSWMKTNVNYFFARLDLSKNTIYAIEDTVFNDLPRLRYLDLSENSIQELQLDLFTNTTVETLILTRNFFSTFPKFISTALKALILRNCQIPDIRADSLTEMNSLLRLDLSKNMIESIPSNLMSNSLQELDLSYNEISSLNIYSLSSLPLLAVLDLRGNKFTEIWYTAIFASNPFLREIEISENQWSCEGFDRNLFLTYEFLTREPAMVTNPLSLLCHSPSNVTYLSWREAYIRTWHPEMSASSYAYLAVVVGLVLGILMTSMVCRFIVSRNGPPPLPATETTALSVHSDHTLVVEPTVMRLPLRDEDLPPSYDEALLMTRLNSSFHSLPDIVDLEENYHRPRRSMSIGDLVDRPNPRERRSMRRTIEVRISDAG